MIERNEYIGSGEERAIPWSYFVRYCCSFARFAITYWV